jgi:hypothetical protein
VLVSHFETVAGYFGTTLDFPVRIAGRACIQKGPAEDLSISPSVARNREPFAAVRPLGGARTLVGAALILPNLIFGILTLEA